MPETDMILDREAQKVGSNGEAPEEQKGAEEAVEVPSLEECESVEYKGGVLTVKKGGQPIKYRYWKIARGLLTTLFTAGLLIWAVWCFLYTWNLLKHNYELDQRDKKMHQVLKPK